MSISIRISIPLYIFRFMYRSYTSDFFTLISLAISLIIIMVLFYIKDKSDNISAHLSLFVFHVTYIFLCHVKNIRSCCIMLNIVM